MSQRNMLPILCIILLWGTVRITHAELVNGDFSDQTVTYGGNITYEQIGIGWVAKGSNPVPDWEIRDNQLHQVTKKGSKTRVGQVFDASDMNGDGWRFEFTLSGENLGRTGSAVVIFGGVDSGTNAPDQRVLSLGADSAPEEASGEWTLLVDLGETEAGSFSLEIAQNLSQYDLMAIRFMSRSAEGQPILSISDLQFVPPYEKEMAHEPNPEDEALDVLRDDVVLSWEPGLFAAEHDVYWGTDFDTVSNATTVSAAYRGRQPDTMHALERLEFGTTYYWRIDEVNAPPTSTVDKGKVWSFTTEPIGYPIDAANITATASSVMLPSSPQATIDGAGLDANDLHSLELSEMWLSDFTGEQPTWIEYEFDKTYKLHEMWVWNQNQVTEPSIGYGFKDVTIEYSVDGLTYTTLGTAYEFARAPGVPSYASNTTVDFDGVVAKYVKLTAMSNWSPFGIEQYGLSEVRFFSIPVLAREPGPASAATNVEVDSTLAWRSGREADRHDVYLSTDEQAVIDGTADVVTVTEPGHAPSLDLASTYYWRVDEANDAETPALWQGDVWNFTTQESIVVDDFDSYNDIEAGQEGSNLVYLTWIDGYVEPPAVRTNGSTIGYTELYQPTMESSVVHGGQLSAPLFYDNTAAPSSEVTANIANLQAGPDWTKHGIGTLNVWFYGDPNNAAQQMYVKINNTKILHNDPESLKRALWQTWPIDLSSYNVSNVSTLSIGFDRLNGLGGKGFVFIDDIELRGAPPEIDEISLIENFDALPVGTNMHTADGWDGWYGDAQWGARVTDVVAYSGNHSLEIVGGPDDLVPN